MKVTINNLSKSFKEDIIFKNFNMILDDNNVNCIIGASGCGKSTLLNMICGLLSHDEGTIEGISMKDISYVFQEDRLIENLTVWENLKITLKKYYKSEILEAEIENLLKMVGIDSIKNKYPFSLSGGMKQRVNIARAFGKPSKVILMDEPFKSLDYKLKYTIIDEFINLLKINKRMVVLVTHDLDEAMYFKGKIFVVGGRPLKINGVFNASEKITKSDILKIM